MPAHSYIFLQCPLCCYREACRVLFEEFKLVNSNSNSILHCGYYGVATELRANDIKDQFESLFRRLHRYLQRPVGIHINCIMMIKKEYSTFFCI